MWEGEREKGGEKKGEGKGYILLCYEEIRGQLGGGFFFLYPCKT